MPVKHLEPKAKILIIDGDAPIVQDLESRLKVLGYTVCGKTAGGEQALELVKQHQPDLVMMDIVLRGEMDGIEVAEVIREKWDIPVVFLTTYADANLLERAKLSYHFGYLMKPFQDRDLKITIEMVLNIASVDSDRRRIEEKLRKSEESFRTIFQNSPLGLFRSSPEGRFHEVNPALAEILGYESPKEVLDHITNIASQIYVDGRRRDEIVGKTMKASGITRYVNRYRRRDGSTFFANLYLKTIRDSSGRPLFLEGIVEDITVRKQMEDALRESEEKYRQLYRFAPAGIYEIDLVQNRLLDVNEIGCDYLEYSLEELKAMDPLDILTPESRELFVERLEKYNIGEKVPEQVECEMITRTGRRLWVLLSARYKYEDGRIVGANVVANDISNRKMIEDLARKNEERFRLIANNSVDSAFFHDQDLRYTWMTKPIKPFALEDILGRTDLDLLGNEYGAALSRFKQNVLENGQEMKDEFKIPMPNDCLSYYEITCSPRTSLSGKIIGLSGFMRDITARREAEQEILRRELQLKEERQNLLEANAAFKLLLKNRDEERQNQKDELLRNVRNQVLPYLVKLKGTTLDRSQRDLIEIIENSLESILPGISAHEADTLAAFTPKEMEVARLVKMGHSSEKIAQIMEVSSQTVAFHRKNIRRKLGLTEKNQNLRSHLAKLSR